MVCFDWKGGIGSSSRVTEDGHAVGVLVLANFGDGSELRVDGVPVGRATWRPAEAARRDPAGSCIAVVATDAPLSSAQLTRVARRAGLGLGAHRLGRAPRQRRDLRRVLDHGARRARRRRARRRSRTRDLDPLFQATVEATEEAVLNALWARRDHERPRRPRGRAAAARAGARAAARHGRLAG